LLGGSLISDPTRQSQINNGYCLNNTGAWGHDLLNDPNCTVIASKTSP
jgi:hypothetical protein